MRKLFSKYLQSTCTPEEFQVITQWMSRKENDSQLSDLMDPFWRDTLLKEPDGQVHPALWDKIKAAIDEQEKNTLQRKLGVYKWGLRIAAVLVTALVLTNVWTASQDSHRGNRVQSFSTTVPNGARANLTLPDGSEVWLNAGSTLSYSSEFLSKRDIELQGEAYVKVVKSNSPFRVLTPVGQVEVTGTIFNVKAHAEDNQFETTVEEGSVSLHSPLLQQSVMIKAGEHARIMNNQWQLTQVDPELYTSWKDGKIIFRSEQLPDVVKRLERWYNVTIELDDDPRLQKICYTGTLEMESFSEVLELLKLTDAIDFSYNDKTRIIKIKHR